MNWFYAETGRQLGPVSDDEFQSLVSSGAVQDTTLVWRKGLPAWLAWADVRQLPPDEPLLTCEHCHRMYPQTHTLPLLDRSICAICKPYFVQMIRERGVSERTEYAGFWARWVAATIDFMITFMVGTVVSMIFGAVSSILLVSVFSTGGFVSSATIQLLLTFVHLLASTGLMIGYHTFFVGRFGATPGKMMMRLRIVMANGDKVTYKRAAIRYLARIVTGLTFLIGYLIAVFDSEHRTLHDYLASTRVKKT